jgi:EAL domain-containing protein (putative c-di-GMP-specific phosphodiesterase class I)
VAAENWPAEVCTAFNCRRRSLGFCGETGLPPDRLELEVTEAAPLDDSGSSLGIFVQLNQMRIALDDFGTGYSALSYLQRFPFEKLKIGRTLSLGCRKAGRAEPSCLRSAVRRILCQSE